MDLFLVFGTRLGSFDSRIHKDILIYTGGGVCGEGGEMGQLCTVGEISTQEAAVSQQLCLENVQ